MSAAEILNPTGKQLELAMGDRNIELIRPDYPVWDIEDDGITDMTAQSTGDASKPADPYRLRRTRLLRSFLDLPCVIHLIFHEDPRPVLSGVLKIEKENWELPNTIAAAGLYEFLRDGSWMLYGCITRIARTELAMTSLFYDLRKPMETVVKKQIVFAIEAFADNDPWRIALNPTPLI